MGNEIQKDDFMLQGGLGSVTVASTGKKMNITKLINNEKDNCFIMTMSPIRKIEVTEDADFEVVQPKQISNGI